MEESEDEKGFTNAETPRTRSPSFPHKRQEKGDAHQITNEGHLSSPTLTGSKFGWIIGWRVHQRDRCLRFPSLTDISHRISLLVLRMRKESDSLMSTLWSYEVA